VEPLLLFIAGEAVRHRFERASERKASIKVAAADRAILFRYGCGGSRSFRRLTVRRNRVGGWAYFSPIGHVSHSIRLLLRSGLVGLLKLGSPIG